MRKVTIHKIEHWKISELSFDHVDFVLSSPEKSLQEYDELFVKLRCKKVSRYSKVSRKDKNIPIKEGKQASSKEEEKANPCKLKKEPNEEKPRSLNNREDNDDTSDISMESESEICDIPLVGNSLDFLEEYPTEEEKERLKEIIRNEGERNTLFLKD